MQSLPQLGSREDSFDVAIIGGGFAGTIVAVGLAQLAGAPLRIAIFDRNGAFGRGVAYRPIPDHCVLNVRAKAMGAFPDREGDFVRWLRAVGYAPRDRDLGERFLPRRLYGDYLESLLDDAANAMTIERRTATVEGIAACGGGYALTTTGPARIMARHVVVAVGSVHAAAGGDAGTRSALVRYGRDPWEFISNGSADRDARVLIVGTGLSALDVLLHLERNAHRGRIDMLSRHGRFPLAHALSSSSCAVEPVRGTPADVVRAVRRLVAAAERGGRCWQDAVDGLRPQLGTIWQQWSASEQRRFLRHAAPLWEVHRHRAPQSTLDVRDRLLGCGQLHVHAGRLVSLQTEGPVVRADFARHGKPAMDSLRADTVIDCTGPGRDVTAPGNALIEALIAGGLARRSALGFGLAASSAGALGEGTPASLHALGPALRGALGESSAVREIRLQALAVARAVAAALADLRTAAADRR